MTWRGDANLAWLRSLAGVEEGKSLARHTSFNIGGPADFLVESADPGPLLREARRRRIPTRVIGAGTNLLVSDEGVEGLLLRDVDRRFRRDGDRVFGGAGLKMMRLARLAADQDLVGLEFAIGIPGTVGGAIYQDAGCWGSEVREVLSEVLGDGRSWKPEELALGYRSSAFRTGGLEGELITGAWFRLRPGDGTAAKEQLARRPPLRRLRPPSDRGARHPAGGPGAGRRPRHPGLPAAPVQPAGRSPGGVRGVLRGGGCGDHHRGLRRW